MGGLRQLQRAENGGPGGNQKKIGKHGADKVIQVCAAAKFANLEYLVSHCESYNAT